MIFVITKRKRSMKILKAISTEVGSEGTILGTNKLPKVIDNKMTVIFLSKEELYNKICNTRVESFIIKEFDI